jgi:hypothetical protein
MQINLYIDLLPATDQYARTSVEPQDEGLVLHVVRGLEEPVEERAAVGLIRRHVPGELPEPDLRRLAGQGLHPVGFLPVEHPLVVVASVQPQGRRRPSTGGHGEQH